MIARALLLAAALVLPAPALADPAATLADATWLEGAWVGEGIGGAPAGEVWSAAAGGQMVGHFWQATADDRVMFYELMMLASDGTGSLVLRLKHFGPDLAGWEGQAADQATAFPLTAMSPGRLDFPGLTYAMQPDGMLLVSVVVANADGSRATLPFRFRRAGR
jgi:hypothetical protein